MKNPVEPTIKSEALSLTAILVSFIASFYFYANFPEKVPVHWNFQGVVDNWSSPEFAAFFFPFLILAIYVLFLILPYIDPKKDRYDEFKKTYHLFKNCLIIFMTLIYFFAGFSGMGFNIPIATVMPIGVGLLFIILGNSMGKIKSNWLMGVRTPWTLSSEKVWNKTNRFSGKIFMLAGLILMLESVMPESYKLPVFIVSLAMLVIAPIGYSLILFNKEKHQ